MTVVTYFEKIKNLMDDVSGLADKSNGFTNFLTVSRKFGYICLHIFHIIYLTKSIWQMILSQTKIFNIFPSTIQLGNIPKILTNNWDRDTINYIPANTFIPSHDLWINRFYLSLSNKSKYCCLTIFQIGSVTLQKTVKLKSIKQFKNWKNWKNKTMETKETVID